MIVEKDVNVDRCNEIGFKIIFLLFGNDVIIFFFKKKNKVVIMYIK